jgi:hypothetical protein
MSGPKEANLEELGRLRTASQKTSAILRAKLQRYVSTLTPLFAPRKVLGEFMQSAFTDQVPGASSHVAELSDQFAAILKESFRISAKLGTPVPNIANQLEIHPWMYRHRLTGDPKRPVTIISPVRWFLAYAGGYTLSDLIESQAQGARVDPEDVKGLVLRSLTLKKLIELSPGLGEILGDLRFDLSVEFSEFAGKTPFIVASSHLSAYRPQDEVIETVVRLSGQPRFEEVIDLTGLDALTDPLTTKIREAVGRLDAGAS